MEGPRENRILDYLARAQGLDDAIFHRLGALVVIWGRAEAELERAIWRLTGEQVAGQRPTTDKMQFAERIEVFEISLAAMGVPEWPNAPGYIASAAQDLLVFRNTRVHGHYTGGMFLGLVYNNLPFHGEIRRRPQSTRLLTKHTLGMAIDAAWSLADAFNLIARSKNPSEIGAGLATRRRDIQRARSAAMELRALPEVAEHEKSRNTEAAAPFGRQARL